MGKSGLEQEGRPGNQRDGMFGSYNSLAKVIESFYVVHLQLTQCFMSNVS